MVSLMFNGIEFDQINALLKNKRSIPIEQYFGEMELPEKEKETRIRAANELYDSMLNVMSLSFVMAQFQNFNYEQLRNSFLSSYISTLSRYVDFDSDLEIYAKNLSYEIFDSTKSHYGEIYYHSPDRAMFISENETNTAFNHNEFNQAIKNGKRKKQWNAIVDNETRPTHLKINGKSVNINDFFKVGNSLMRYPRDIFGDPEEIINCRCTIIYM